MCARELICQSVKKKTGKFRERRRARQRRSLAQQF